MQDKSKLLCEKVFGDAFHGKSFRQAIKEHCDEMRKEDKFSADIYQILLEADAQWLDVQFYMMSQLIRDPQVEIWGRENVPDWQESTNEDKIKRLFEHFATTDGLRAARDYIMKSDKVSPTKSPMYYDVHELDQPASGQDPRGWEEFGKTEVFQDLKAIFLQYI
jgi:hypothetical protein